MAEKVMEDRTLHALMAATIFTTGGSVDELGVTDAVRIARQLLEEVDEQQRAEEEHAAATPLGRLYESVEKALAVYAKTGDHKHVGWAHEVTSDCLACNLARVLR